MKSIKISVVKRILIFLCCTVVLTSSVFMSYDNTLMVKAVDEADLLKDFIFASLASIGVFVSGGTATTLALAIAPSLTNAGFDLYDYITQNEDGTTTISQDFINLVLQAYKEFVGGSFSGNLEQNENLYYVYGESEFIIDWFNEGRYVSVVEGFTYAYPVAFLFANGNSLVRYSYWGTSLFDTYKGEGYNLIPFFYNGNPDSANGGINLLNNYLSLVGDPKPNPFVNIYKNGEKDSVSSSLSVFSIFGNPGGISASVSSSSIPIYTNFDQMVSDLQSGKYTHADNLSSGVNFGQTSNYTGTYSGGDIKLSTEKLNGIQDKLNEINETDKSIDDKLKDLLEWLGINGGSGDIKPGSTDFKGLLDMLSTYFNAVIMRLDAIIQGIDGLLWFESTDDGEEDPTNDLADMLKKILDNPETGSQEVADSLSTSFSDVASGLTKKFPFSIPWDIYGLFSVFANVSAPSPQALVMSAAYDDRGYMLSSDAMGYGIQTYADTPSTGGSASGAPYFELPILVESFGIDEVIIVDLEGFTSLSTFSRTMFSLIFGILLIKWTIAFLSAINEVMPDFLND